MSMESTFNAFGLSESTFAEIVPRQKEYIAQLKEGTKADQELATFLATCREGHRCYSPACLVCLYRREHRSFPDTAVSKYGSLTSRFSVYVGNITVIGRRRRVNEKKLRRLMASMKLIGLQTPITVWLQAKKVILVTGWYRLQAAIWLGWDSIACIELYSSKFDANAWENLENIARADATVLERAEYIERLRLLLKERHRGQVAPPGGRQPVNFGIKATARILGLTREEVRRSKAIASIFPKAKDRIVELGLDDNQQALLEIAKQTTSAAQLRLVEEIAERKIAESNREATAADRGAEMPGWPAAGSADTELRCHDGTGGGSWRDGSLHASSSLRRCG